MHEAGAIEGLINMVTSAAKENGSKRIIKIHLVIGETGGYLKDSLQHYFTFFAKNTLAEGAELEIQFVSQKLFCNNCNTNFVRERFSFACPTCGSEGLITKLGSEFFVDSIEVES